MRNILLLNDDWYFPKENTFPNEIKEDYEKIKEKLPGLRKVEGDFGDVDMYKYAVARGRIGFLRG